MSDQTEATYKVTSGMAGKTDEFSTKDWINFHVRIECNGTMIPAEKEQAEALFAEFVKKLQNL